MHGDIKATNILVSDTIHALLCDFGLTKLPNAATSTTLKGAGNPRWQSPELMDGKSRSYQSDVYAFGMTIAEVSVRRSEQHPLAQLIFEICTGAEWQGPLFRAGQ